MQVSVEGYYNAVKPQVLGEELLGDWTIRTQWQILFPNWSRISAGSSD